MNKKLMSAVFAGIASLSYALTIETKYGNAELVKYVPQSTRKVAAVLYTTDTAPADPARCPIAKINARGYAVLTLDCSKVEGAMGAGRAAAIAAVRERMVNDPDIDADKIGVLCDRIQVGWDKVESNWMALIDSYDRKGWNADPSKVAKKRTFKVLAWNIEGGSHKKKETLSLVKFIKDINPDVMLVSENYGRYPEILEALGGYWNGRRFSMNVVMFSKWPIVASLEPFEAPWNYLDPTGPFNFGLAEIDVLGQRVRACPLWINWEHGKPRFSNTREFEMRGILHSVRGAIAQAEDIPLIIGGDFNGPDAPHADMMREAGFIDTHAALNPGLDRSKAYTWKVGSRQQYIDFIYFKGSKLKLRDAEIFHSHRHKPFSFKGFEYESFPSDHGFVLSTFDLELPAPESEVFVSKGSSKIVKGVKYRGEQGCELDLCVPTGKKGFASVVWLHGGGLTSGKRHWIGIDTNSVAVASVDYRLMPNVGPDVCIDDAAAAAAWVKRNIAAYGGDPKRVFIAGHSAGGYLTYMLGLDARWLAKHGLSPFDFAGYFPVSGQVTKHFAVRKHFGCKGDSLQPVVDEWAPMYHLSKKTPAFFMALGDRRIEWPMRVEESEFMFRSLKAMGNGAFEFKSIPETDHCSCVEPAMGLLMDFISRH